MSAKDEDFLRQLLDTFLIEAREHLQVIATGLLELESGAAPDQFRPIIERVFRAAHSLKGAARAVDRIDIETRCQTLEETFATWRRQALMPNASALDSAHRALDGLSVALGEPVPRGQSQRSDATPPPLEPSPTEMEPIQNFGGSLADAAPRAESAPEETVRIAVSKLEARLVAAEEMLAVKLAAIQRTQDMLSISGHLNSWYKEWATIEPEMRKLRRVLHSSEPRESTATAVTERVLHFVEWTRDQFRLLDHGISSLAESTQRDQHIAAKLVDELLEQSKQMLLMPFSSISMSFPKIVRDLCRDQGKEAELSIRGQDVELDKQILEELKDPLIHLLRNSVDHGIERREQRVQAGKPIRATINLAVSRVNGNAVEILVSDDGSGIDVPKVRQAAIEQGLMSAAEVENLSESDARMLVFASALSTSAIITRVSGRGLGLAIVRERAEKFGGRVSVESSPGKGTTFRMVVPAQRATFRGILVKAGGHEFILPTTQVDRVIRVRPTEIEKVENRDTISVAGITLAFLRLADVLELPVPASSRTPDSYATAVILGSGDQKVAFEVDAVLDEHEVLSKPLRKPLSRVRNISGATVLGSGKVAPILHVGDLLKSVRRAWRKSIGPGAAAEQADTLRSGSILIAEDSITSRMLLKSILESAGYSVKTAVDGAEAFALLRTERFDLVVSDVEMPRLNGFDLTARIRSDKALAEMPVILVTALESRDDRERGIDVGASAYLVKSNFDQSNLLEAVRRLI